MLDVGFLLIIFLISDILREYKKIPAAWNVLIDMRLRDHGQKEMAQNWTLESHIHSSRVIDDSYSFDVYDDNCDRLITSRGDVDLGIPQLSSISHLGH